MKANFQRRPRYNRSRSGPFPWRRFIFALIVSVLLALGTLLFILSIGYVISRNWFYILPPIFVLVGLLIPFFQWQYPISQGETTTHSSRPQQSPVTTPDTTSTWNVPYPHNPFFTGREALLTRLYDNLHCANGASRTQPQALIGMGGMGKTQLAVEYAYINRDTYRSILWTTATTYETLFADFVFLAEAFDLPEKDARDQNITMNAVMDWLETHSSWLLIFDSADNLELIRDFLPTGGKGHIILTTRSQTLGTLAQPLEVTKLEPDDAAVLLLHRAKILSLEALLADASETDQADAKAIASLFDGLPLAIDQAGAYIETMQCSVSDYKERYQQERTTLLKDRGRFPTVHFESVTTTFSLSFRNVQENDPAAADLLRFFAFLSPEAIPIELLIEGTPDLGKPLRRIALNPQKVDKVLSTLYSYSLVRRDTVTNTLYLHLLVQDVLKDEMSAGTQHQWAARTVRAVSRTFPTVEVETWHRCQRLIPQAVMCLNLIDKWHMSFAEATRLLNQAGYYLHKHAQYAEAEPLYQRALAIREKRLGANHPDTAQSFNNLAGLYDSQGKYEQAEPLYQRALAICEKMLGADHSDTATSLNNLAALYYNQGKYEQAEPLYQRALAIREKSLGADHSDTAGSLNNLAFCYYNQGKYEQAEPLYQRALAIREKSLGANHPDTAQSLNNLALLYHSQGKYEQAEPLYQRALAIREKRLGANHPDTAGSLNNLAALYNNQGKYEQAEPLYQRALAIREKSLGADHSDTAGSLNNLAFCYYNQGKYEQAEPLYQRALAIREKSLGANHPDTAQSLNNLALLYHSQGKYEQAEPLYQRALAIREKRLGANHPDTAGSLNNLAALYNNQGKYEQAEPLYQRALIIYEKMLGPEHPTTIRTRENYTNLLPKTKDKQEQQN